MNFSQKAPSAKRCIKTGHATRPTHAQYPVRKHRAPKGALRLPITLELGEAVKNEVRKHRAPKGALRPWDLRANVRRQAGVRKHRAPKGALRHTSPPHQTAPPRSESTERQKVH